MQAHGSTTQFDVAKDYRTGIENDKLTHAARHLVFLVRMTNPMQTPLIRRCSSQTKTAGRDDRPPAVFHTATRQT